MSSGAHAIGVLAVSSLLGGCGVFADLGDERTLDVGHKNNVCTTSGAGVVWANQFGDAGYQVATGVAVGPGGIDLAGLFAGALDFGNGPLISEGDRDYFLARFDHDGTPRWSHRFGDDTDQSGTAVAVEHTPDGGAVLYGFFNGTIELEPGKPHTSLDWDGFIASFDAAGTHRWDVVFASAGKDGVSDIAVDPSTGAVGASVWYSGVMLDHWGAPLPHAGGNDLLVTNIAADGTPIFTKSYGSPGKDEAIGIDVDANGRLAVGGELGGVIDFGDGPLTPGQPPDAFLAVFNADGSLAWSKHFPDTNEAAVKQVVFHRPTGDVIVIAGVEPGSIHVGGYPLSVAGPSGVFARLSPTGEHITSRAVTGLANPRSIVTDREGNSYVSGPFGGVIDFGGEPIASEGGQDGIVAKLGPSFERMWTLQVGSLRNDNVWGVTVDESNVYVSAYFEVETMIKGCGPLKAVGDADVLLMKLDR